MLSKAVGLLSSSEGSGFGRYSEAFFRKFDLWKRVFELRSQGVPMEGVAKTLGVTKKTAYTYYHRYIELKSKVIENQLSEDQMKEVAEYLLRLEQQREELSFEVATAGSKANLTAEEQMAKLATRKVLLDVEKQIAWVKKSLGLWHSVPEQHFRAKKAASQKGEYDDKKRRIKQLLLRAAESDG